GPGFQRRNVDVPQHVPASRRTRWCQPTSVPPLLRSFFNRSFPPVLASRSRMSSRAFSVVVAFILLGLGASVAASWVHYQAVASADYISFCDVNATFSCTQAYQSEYGRLLGVPVAILG